MIVPFFIIVPLAAAMIIPLFGRKYRRMADVVACLITLGLVIFSILNLGYNIVFKFKWPPPSGIILVLDGLSALMLLIISVISFSISLYSARYMERYGFKRLYYSLFLLAVTGLNGLVLTGDLFSLFLFIELVAISSCGLITYGRRRETLRPAFKYLVLWTIASFFILLGLALLYSLAGSLNIADLANRLSSGENVILFSLCLFMVGLGLKAGVVPFHAWLPEVLLTAPIPVSALFAGLVIKVVGLYALVRVVFNIFGLLAMTSEVFLFLGALSMMLGALLASGQRDFRRLLAFSTISETGIILVGIGLGTNLGLLAGLFHLINHSVIKTLLFFNAGSIEYATGKRDLDQIAGLRQKMPVTGFSSTIASFSISGLPPFNGFWSKGLILWACVEANHPVYALWVVLATLVTAATFIKVRHDGFRKEDETGQKITEVPGLMRVAMIILMVLCFSLGLILLPGLREVLLIPAVRALTEGGDYIHLVLGE